MSDKSNGAICVVGGYGHVGANIAALLAPGYPDRVLIAGRDAGKAEAEAARIGDGCRGIGLDAARGRAPEDVSTVIMCLDWQDPSFAADCFAEGIDYVDISAKGPVLEMIEGLDMKARRNEATGLIGVGMSPGLSNLLAADLATSRPEPPASIDLFVLLGAGDDHGLAALEWTLDHLDSEFEVVEDGHRRRVRAQRETSTAEIPGRKGVIFGVRFDFPEQRSLARTLGLPTVSSWMATLPPLSGRAMRYATMAGLPELTRRPRSRRGILWALSHQARGSDECGVIARATWPDGSRSQATVVSRDQSLLTARVTALMAGQLIDGTIPPGVHHSESVIDREPVFAGLARAGIRLDARLPRTA